MAKSNVIRGPWKKHPHLQPWRVREERLKAEVDHRSQREYELRMMVAMLISEYGAGCWPLQETIDQARALISVDWSPPPGVQEIYGPKVVLRAWARSVVLAPRLVEAAANVMAMIRDGGRDPEAIDELQAVLDLCAQSEIPWPDPVEEDQDADEPDRLPPPTDPAAS